MYTTFVLLSCCEAAAYHHCAGTQRAVRCEVI